MPWSMGLMGASSPVAAGAFDLLETTTLTSSASSVTFSGLDSYTDYKHLQIRFVARNSSLSDNGVAFMGMTLNGDAGTNYSWHSLTGNGSTVASSSSSNVNTMTLAKLPPRPDYPAFASGVIDILDFSNSSKNTTIRTLSGNARRNLNTVVIDEIAEYSGSWRNTNAVTSITLASAGSPLYTNSRFSLYGIKG